MPRLYELLRRRGRIGTSSGVEEINRFTRKQGSRRDNILLSKIGVPNPEMLNAGAMNVF